MSDSYFFTSESVGEGHPDKVADQISDAVLDAILRQDKTARVAAETLVKDNLVVLAGEITKKREAHVDYSEVARDTIKRIGYTEPAIGFDASTCTVIVAYGEQSKNIAQGVDRAVDMDQGAGELDMVVNIGKVLSGDWDYVAKDIATVVEAAHSRKAIVKVIFENCFLQDEHKIRLCKICGDLRADFVKTSTGCGDSGATDHDLALMRKHSPPHVQVKAAGGVKSFERVLVVRKLGVTRIGASVTKAILDECRQSLGQ